MKSRRIFFNGIRRKVICAGGYDFLVSNGSEVKNGGKPKIILV